MYIATRIYVLKLTVRLHILLLHLSTYSEKRSCFFSFFDDGMLAFPECLNFQVIYDKLTGRSRGFGFVTMSSVEEAEVAAQQFNGYVSFLHLLSFKDT